MTSLADIEARIGQVAQDLLDHAEHLKSEVAPVVHDGAVTLQKLTSSKIVSELMQYGEEILPADVTEAIVSIIRGAGEAANRIAQLTAPPAPAVPEQEQPL